MPDVTPAPLVTIAPFNGVQSNLGPTYSTADRPYTNQNLDSSGTLNCFAPMKGRTSYGNLPSYFFPLAITLFDFSTLTIPASIYDWGINVNLNRKYIAFGINSNNHTAEFCVFDNLGYTFYPLNPTIPSISLTPYTASMARIGKYIFCAFGLAQGPVSGVAANAELFQIVKIDSNFVASYCQTPDISQNSVVATATGTGVLNGTYTYYFTNVDGVTGQESSAMGLAESEDVPVTLPLVYQTVTAVNQQVVINGSGVYVAPTVGSINQVNIYRNSSNSQSGVPQFIGSVAITIGSPWTYTDNAPDNAVTGQQLVLHQDCPPNFITIKTHRGRLFGFGLLSLHYTPSSPSVGSTVNLQNYQGSDLWYSYAGQPYAWDNTNQVIDMGRNQYGDDAVALAEVGSILMCIKQKSTWALYGSSPSDFVGEPLFPIGGISQALTVEAFGAVYWMDQSANIWSYSGQLQMISGDIQTELRNLINGNNLPQSSAFAYQRSVFFCISGGNGNPVTFEYNIDRQQWFKSNIVVGPVYYDVSQNLVLGTSVNTSQFVQLFQATTDLGFAVPCFYTTPILDCGAPEIEKEFTHILLYGNLGTTTVTVTVTVDGGVVVPAVTRTFPSQTNVAGRYMQSLPKGTIGSQVQVQISASSSTYFEITKVIVYGVAKRQLVIPV